MTEIVYGTGRIDTGGRRFRNARFFAGVEADATAVILAGEYRAIADAYRRAGVPVRHLRPGQPITPLPTIPDDVKAKAAPKKPRKTKEAVNPVDAPQPEANGLTIRELNADLEAAHIEIDPADSPAQKLAKLETAEAA